MSITYDVACTLGLEPAVQAELAELGIAESRPRRGGVLFEGTPADGYRANLWLRSAVRVTERLIEASVSSEDELYAVCRELPVEDWISAEQTLAVDASVRDAALTHSGYVAQRVKDAIVDRYRDLYGRRPSVDTRHPDLPLKLVWKRDQLLLARDLSGRSLHKRGWRPIQVKSPLNEATAAGLLRLSGWTPDQALVDPFCGSGTFLIEAAQRAIGRAPGLRRRFAFENWADTDSELWAAMKAEAEAQISVPEGLQLEGADHHEGALRLAQRGADAAGVGELISFRHAPIEDYTPSFRPDLVLTNPPWGLRLESDDEEQLANTWASLGAFLKRHAAPGEAWILSGEKALTQHLRLRAERRIAVKNGPIDCRWIRYELLPPR